MCEARALLSVSPDGIYAIGKPVPREGFVKLAVCEQSEQLQPVNPDGILPSGNLSIIVCAAERS